VVLLKQFDVVILTKELREYGLFKWHLGAIVEIYDENNFEVEFCDKNGITIFLGTLSRNCIELAWVNETNQYVGRFGELLKVLFEVRSIINSPNTSLIWSNYNNVKEVLDYVDLLIDNLKHSEIGTIERLKLFFAPTGELQDISIDSGWGERYIEISYKFDKLIA
jgi:hypothetical protein